MIDLSPARRRELRAAAHHLNPVVSVAGNGLTPTVLGEIDRSLQAHELIKIKVHGTERTDRDALMQAICAELDAAPVQHIGTILVVWRERREEQAAATPKAATAVNVPGAAKAKSARAFAAAARRTALIKAASDKRRLAEKRTRNLVRKSGPLGNK
ncbi:MAG: RNA-binding protein [Azoarcus sp.]|uniref:Putative RNA-binding protein, YhbY family n=1 Tax=Aromatoleum tolulyticum TaxID=34027 RepID=A0A1N6R9Z6_9RHOO|nr:YhbY family RNA-binding protein [Aromatoleum tolulyticum]MCK9984123.1 RNA-binding protein [Azoarcus sp.]SIQ25627.1 putative RNA-binding protein, YhbY family [Aromatoleum tolulyticum]